MNIFRERRIGMFEFTQAKLRKDYSRLLELFGLVIITSAASDIDQSSVVYVGYSELFEPLRAHETPPRYRMWYRRGVGWQATRAPTSAAQ